MRQMNKLFFARQDAELQYNRILIQVSDAPVLHSSVQSHRRNKNSFDIISPGILKHRKKYPHPAGTAHIAKER